MKVETVHPNAGEADFVFECLNAEARHMQAAYVVMGGYSHNRLSEYVFGGLTRSMLAASSIPLFIAH